MHNQDGALRAVSRLAAMASVASAVCAVAALIGFVTVVGTAPIGEAATRGAFLAPAIAALLAVLLLGVAVVGLFLHQSPRLSSLGSAGFVVALIGTMLAAGAAWTYVFVLPHFAAQDPQLVNVGTGSVLAGFLSSYAVLSVGWILFGVASLRAGVFSRGAIWLLIVGAVIAFLPLPSRTLVLSLAAAWLGSQVLTQTRRPAG